MGRCWLLRSVSVYSWLYLLQICTVVSYISWHWYQLLGVCRFQSYTTWRSIPGLKKSEPSRWRELTRPSRNANGAKTLPNQWPLSQINISLLFCQHLTPTQTFITTKEKWITTFAFSDFLGSGSVTVMVRDRVSIYGLCQCSLIDV